MTQKPEWVLVPREPTPEMVGAFWRVKNGHHFHDEPPPTDRSDYAAYRAMIAASPSPEGTRGEMRKRIIDVLDKWHDGSRERKADDILAALTLPPVPGVDREDGSSSASLPAHGAPQSSAPETEATCDLEGEFHMRDGKWGLFFPSAPLDEPGQRLRLLYAIQKQPALLDAAENVVIAWGMGWDLDASLTVLADVVSGLQPEATLSPSKSEGGR